MKNIFTTIVIFILSSCQSPIKVNKINLSQTNTFYDNGQVKSAGKYINNKKDGKWLYFYPNGMIKIKAYFDNGVLYKTLTKYNQDGTVKQIINIEKTIIKKSEKIIDNKQNTENNEKIIDNDAPVIAPIEIDTFKNTNKNEQNTENNEKVIDNDAPVVAPVETNTFNNTDENEQNTENNEKVIDNEIPVVAPIEIDTFKNTDEKEQNTENNKAVIDNEVPVIIPVEIDTLEKLEKH